MPTSKPKPPRQSDDPAEYDRFVEIARSLGVDEAPDALDRAFDRVIPPTPRQNTARPPTESKKDT